MIKVLSYIDNALKGMGMPYEFGEWSQALRYPYFVGGFTETEHRFEDNYTAGIFEINGWTRESRMQLMVLADMMKKQFQDVQAIQDDTLIHITYDGTQDIPTGEDELYRITITLNVEEWEGE